MRTWWLGKWREMTFFPRCWFLLSLVAFCVLLAGMVVRGVYSQANLITALLILVTVIALCIPGRHVPILARIVAVPFVLMYGVEIVLDLFNGSMLSWSYWDPSGFLKIFLSTKHRISEYQPIRLYFLFLSVGVMITGKWVSTFSELKRVIAAQKQSYSTT